MTVGAEPTHSNKAQLIAEPNTILRATVGSTVHGLAVGTDDRDEIGVCLEPPEYVLGLKRFEQWVHRTQPEGTRSGPGDLDLTIYGLRKWCHLALGGNPTILLLLFVPDDVCSILTPHGRALRGMADAFAAKRAGKAFLGYMTQQRLRLTGERGQKNVKRPELVEAYGFDTKYAGHILRLGYQGIEFLETGRLALPMGDEQRREILAVRRGEASEQYVLAECDRLTQRIEDLLVNSRLPDNPDYAQVNRFLVETYQAWWGYQPWGYRRSARVPYSNG